MDIEIFYWTVDGHWMVLRQSRSINFWIKNRRSFNVGQEQIRFFFDLQLLLFCS